MPAPREAAAAAIALNGQAAPTPDDDAFYPCSDGRPMAENMWQGHAIVNAVGDIGAARPSALVAPDILMYWERGNTRKCTAPDVLVAFGLGRRNRRSYYVWKEGKPPDWVLEVASSSTALKDLNDKRRTYAKMGVPEYWLFDPQGSLFRPRGKPQLQGLELSGGEYRPLAAVREQGLAMIRSKALGLYLRAEDELIRFRDPATGEDVPHRDEETARAEREAELREREAMQRLAAQARAEREAELRLAAEARIAELERLHGSPSQSGSPKPPPSSRE